MLWFTLANPAWLWDSWLLRYKIEKGTASLLLLHLLLPIQPSSVVIHIYGLQKELSNGLANHSVDFHPRTATSFHPSFINSGPSSRLSASRAGSVVRSTEPENRAMSPSYSRYASTLDDTGDWGFSTLRRRNSRVSGSCPAFLNDDIRF